MQKKRKKEEWHFFRREDCDITFTANARRIFFPDLFRETQKSRQKRARTVKGKVLLHWNIVFKY